MYKKLIVIIIFTVFLLSSCMVYHTYNGEPVKSFRKDLSGKYKKINRLKLEYSMPSIRFNYIMEKDFDKEDAKKIFKRTKNLILSEAFQKEFFKHFFERYTVEEGESFGYPDVYIMFFNKGEEVPLLAYYSEKVDTIYEIEDGIIEYDVWKYSDENKEVHEMKE